MATGGLKFKMQLDTTKIRPIVARMKWLIAAAGKGTRLHPTTLHINKHLLPVGSVSMIQRILAFASLHAPEKAFICVNPGDAASFEAELNGAPHVPDWRVYEQEGNGVAAVVTTARKKGLIAESEPFVLVLGDQFFTAPQDIVPSPDGCGVFLVRVPASAAGSYGILDPLTMVVVEKPKDIKPDQSVAAVVGLYVFPGFKDKQLSDINPSSRGELEVADLLNAATVSTARSVRGEWCDMGTWDGIRAAAGYIEAVVAIDAAR